MSESYTHLRDMPLAARKDGQLTVRAQKYLHDMSFTGDSLRHDVAEAAEAKDTEKLAFIAGFAVAVLMSESDEADVRETSTELLVRCMDHIRSIDK